MDGTSVALPRHRTEPWLVRAAVIGAVVLFLVLFLFVPLLAVFAKAFEKGWAAYVASVDEPDARSALRCVARCKSCRCSS